jgi:predicted ATPase
MEMQIESITIKKYRVFDEVTIRNIPRMAVFVGPNGSGKSTLFDVFGFLRDALVHNVTKALAVRGYYREIVTRGTKGPIEIILKFREAGGPLVTYHVAIGQNGDGQPSVTRELLKYRRGQQGKPWHFLDFRNGKGRAVVNEEDYGKKGAIERRESQELESQDILAIKGLGQFQKFRAVSLFRKLIENWHVSDFHITAARNSPEAGVAEHLSAGGENLPLVAQYMYAHHRRLFDQVLRKMKERVPGITNVQAAETEDGRVVLKFQDGAFKDPFIAKNVSDGTIKMFAYLMLLYDPTPYPLLCVEEPENQLYPRLLGELTEEFREYARRGGQVFVSTHSPEVLNAVELNEVFWLDKKTGVTRVFRPGDTPVIRNLMKEGDSLGTLWKQGILEKAAAL